MREHSMTLATLRRLLGIAGIALLGGALALAPILAFTDGMTIVSGAGLAGVALLIAMRLLPARHQESEDRDRTHP